MIDIQHLVKSFDGKNIVNIKNLTIQKGTIFALLGPNAAGKTTTIRMLATIIPADEADVNVAGLNLQTNTKEIQKQIGYVAQSFGLYAELSVIQNIRFYASLYGISDEKHFEALMQKYQISNFKNTKAGILSGGYKRRLALVCALAHDPDVIFLDEPTAGIDPVTRKGLWDIFYELAREGKTLFITTHYMEEASRCHKIAFLNEGHIITYGSPKEVENSLSDYDVYLYAGEFKYQMLKILGTLKEIYLLNQFGSELRMLIEKSANINLIKGQMKPFINGTVILTKAKANLEDVFIALTQKAKR